MKSIAKIVSMVCVFVVCFLPSGFSQYAELVGEWVEIHGPFCWDKLAVARDEETCDLMNYALCINSKTMFLRIWESTDVVGITKNTKAMVLETKPLEYKAKVLILTGINKGITGWIPIEWLHCNTKNRPQFKDYP
ncbi:MAG: hypothetical protein JSW40_07275 [Candidatus Omnitrophota bacterium]|nr:MAG: hypothetical protein JSW40_07275 [Candidatus Omnitrophota bacterium]